MTRNRSIGLLALVAATCGAGHAAASLVLSSSDQGTFYAAAGAIDPMVGLIGLEDFEGNGVTDGTSVIDTIVGGSSSGAFSSDLAVPASIRSGSSNNSVRVHNNTAAPDYPGSFVSNSTDARPIWLTFDELDNVKAVGFTLLTPNSGATNLSVVANLHDGTTPPTFSVTVDDEGSTFLSVLTGASDSPINQIRIGSGVSTTIAVDNVSVFAVVPEPSMGLAFGLVGSAVVAVRSRRQRTEPASVGSRS